MSKFLVLMGEATQQKEKQFHSYELSQYIKNNLLERVYFAQFVAKIPNTESLLQLLLILIENSQNTTQEQQTNFIEQCKNTDISGLNENGVIFLINMIKNIFPEIYSIGDTKSKVRAILLGKYHPDNTSVGMVQLLPEENFYFRKHEEMVNNNDVFPEQGNMIHLSQERLHGLKDICIFDTFGNKVFWGDVGKNDIKNIKGTYYILSQSEGWREVPEFAKGNITSIKAVKDRFLETLRSMHSQVDSWKIPLDVQYLIPEYVRALAIGKIENGQYRKNFRKIDM